MESSDFLRVLPDLARLTLLTKPAVSQFSRIDDQVSRFVDLESMHSRRFPWS